ncbi:MAG: hypothetical protein M3N22_01430, partial [Acidobacteriota bacterium]|nr:hypothetical protein [Acidobacteriota bacterium]
CSVPATLTAALLGVTEIETFWGDDGVKDGELAQPDKTRTKNKKQTKKDIVSNRSVLRKPMQLRPL